MIGYRTSREMCFYCKYQLVQGLAHVILGMLWVNKGFPWGYLLFIIATLAFAIFLRWAQRENERELKREQEAYTLRRKRQEK